MVESLSESWEQDMVVVDDFLHGLLDAKLSGIGSVMF